MIIIFASSEIRPYATTGGLGEVSYSLPRALHELGLRVIRIMPMYRSCAEGSHPVRDTGLRMKIPVGFQVYPAEVWVDDSSKPITYFIRRDEYFDRRGIYGLPERDYDDNFERYVFFQKAVVALIDELRLTPDILHCNDWATALIPLYLSFGLQGMGRDKGSIRSVFSIHNLAYQGSFSATEFATTNLPFSCFSIQLMEFYGHINCLKAGLMSADGVTTVSQGYAQEILTPEFGSGLDGVLRSLGDRFQGITNGADYSIWDPAHDPLIARTYSADDLTGKRECKQALFNRLGFQHKPEQRMLVGMVSRLVDQKGLDLLVEVIPNLMQLPICFAILGSGEPKYHNACSDWMARWPGQFHATHGFNETLAHQIQSGSDVFLMPSKFEPCGLGQLYAKRYGTVPIVHPTGGLKDTVKELDTAKDTGSGFLFSSYEASELLRAVQDAVELYNTKRDVWQKILSRIMQEDHSWIKSAKQYSDLYKKVTAEPPRSLEIR